MAGKISTRSLRYSCLVQSALRRREPFNVMTG